MSRITGSEVPSLMAAYGAVYAPQELTEEQIWEEVENWVNSLLEEGYDLSEYTWEEMYEAYIEEAPVSPVFNTKAFGDFYNRQATSQGMDRTFRAGGGQAALRAGKTPLDIMKQGAANLRPSAPAATTPTRTPTAPAATTPTRTPTAPAATRPAAPKVSPSTPAKPAGPAMGKLGGTTFERRTPTSAELKAAQSARASGASPEKALQAAKAVSAPKVAPSNTLSSTVAAASKPAAFSPAPEVKATNTIAAAPKPAPVSPRQQRLNMEMEYDAYDIVLEYLLSEGHVETVEEAHYVMMEMDAETIGSIVEERRDPRGRVSSGPMNVYRKPEGKPDQAHLDAVKSYDEKQKKKSPEQKKQELDDYIQRQRENK
jgi:hypothetical protein